MRLSTFRVQGYKNFQQEIVLEDLGPLNVIHGDNNVGKSNLVESIGLLFVLLDEIFVVRPRAQPPPIGAMRSERPLLDRHEEPDVAGEAAPPVERKRIDPEYLAGHGYPEREIFNLSAPLPIRLEGTFSIAPAELSQAGIQPLLPCEHVRVAVRLTRLGSTLEAELRSFEIGPGIDALASLPADPEHQRFLRQLAFFLVESRPAGAVQSALRFALVATNRAIPSALPAPGQGNSIGHRRRDLIPQDLCLALYDAKESTDSALSRPWKLFVSAMQRFEDMLGAGAFVAVYDRRAERASLVFENANDERIPASMLGSGVQQAALLVGGLLMTGASLLAIEEPELSLKFTRQLLLIEVLRDLVASDAGPSQLFMTSHSPAFESGEHFYAMRASPEGPTVEKRPISEAAQFTAHLAVAPATGDELPPICYVSSDGLVLVPEEIRELLGLQSGGGVLFIERKDTGHVEMLSDEQFLGLLREPGEAENDRG